MKGWEAERAWRGRGEGGRGGGGRGGGRWKMRQYSECSYQSLFQAFHYEKLCAE